MSKKRRRGQELAARLRAGLDRRLRADQDRAEAEELAHGRAREERDAVLEDLAAFGEALGHFEVRRRKGTLELKRGEASLRFEPEGEAAVLRVSGDGLRGEVLLDWEPRLDRWVLIRRQRLGADQRELLFDAGLERLVRLAFQVAPAEVEAPAGVEPPAGRDEAEPPAPLDAGGLGGKRTL